MIPRLKITYKLLWVNLISILATVLFAGGFWVYTSFKNHEESFTKRITSQVNLVANNSSTAILLEDWNEVKLILSALKLDSAMISAGVVIDESEYALVNFNVDPFSENSSTSNFWGPEIKLDKLAYPVLSSNETIATLEVIYQNKEIYEAFIHSIYGVLIVFGLALLIGLWLSLYLQHFVINPIQNLSEVAKQVSSSNDYTLRGNYIYFDEIGSLTENFNNMLEVIEKRDLLLEQTVINRTKLLEEQNQEIAIQINERVKSESAYRISEEKFEQAFLNAPVGMVLLDEDKEFLKYNRAMTLILDKPRDQPLFLDDIITQSDMDHLESDFNKLIKGDVIKFECEVKCSSLSGKIFDVILSFSVVKGDEGKFQYIVLQLQDITDYKKLAAKLEYQATHDMLTGLPNSRALHEVLAKIVSSENPEDYALCILDLDQFKVVNDTCGHAAGDELLRQLAQLLAQEVNNEGLVVRIGGDEFSVLLYQSSKEKVKNTTEKLRHAIEQWEFNWKGRTFRVGASIGVVNMNESHKDVAKLIQQADAACFVAKDLGRNRVYIVEGDEDREIQFRQGEMRWVQRVQEALESDLFVLYSQPIKHLNNPDESNQNEILLRLYDPDLKDLIPPGAFIPAAERYGLSPKIDKWVISKLIEILQDNPELAKQDDYYWVNLSGVSLGDSSFLEFLEESIREAGLISGLINFEITETAIMNNISHARSTMHRLQAIGCRFALDDFGSGVSSFGYLKQLPVDRLKIDGKFVQDILSDEIDFVFVKSIIDISKIMGIETVAEYVETDEIRNKLIEIGADYGQGYTLGEPKPLI